MGCRCMGEIFDWAGGQWTACVSNMPGQQCVLVINGWLFLVEMLPLFVDLAPDFVKPYKINDKTVNQAFELKHGKSMRTFNMDKVSNGPITDVRWMDIM